MSCFIKGMKAVYDTEKEEWNWSLDEPKQLELPLETKVQETKH
jgi:hypothetical protein